MCLNKYDFEKMKLIIVPIAALLFLPFIGLILPQKPLEESGVIELNSVSNMHHLWHYLLPIYMNETFKLILGVSIGVLILGVGNAWLVVNYQFPGKKGIELALILPLAIPAYVMAYLFVDLFQFAGPIQTGIRLIFQADSLWFFPDPRSLFGAILTFSLCFYPYVYLIMRTQFIERNLRLMEVSATLGYGQTKTFLKLAIPMARPAMMAAIALVIMEVLADYGAVSYFGIQTFSMGIFKAWLSYGDRVTAIQLALGLCIVVIFIFLIEQMSRSKLRYVRDRNKSLKVIKLGRLNALFACVFSGGTVLLGFVLPILLLLKSVIELGLQIDTRYLNGLTNSLIVSTITTFISVSIAVGLNYVVRTNPSYFWLNRLLGFGYALPGMVLGIGILSLLEFLDLTWWITTSFWILIYAYLVRFLASSVQSIEAGYSRISNAIDESATLLGQTKYQILKRVHMPLLSRSITIAAIFIFVDVMKELPATMLLRPFNFETLAIQIHQFAADERLHELAFPSLNIIIAGLIPVYILTKLIAKN
jgi:iron(III) transport system permease protein